MNSQAAEQDSQTPEANETLARVIPINTARADAEAVLELSDKNLTQRWEDYLASLGDLTEITDEAHYKALFAQAFSLMDEYVAAGLLVKNDKNKYEPHPAHEEGQKMIEDFIAGINLIRQLKPKKSPGNTKLEQKDKKPKSAAEKSKAAPSEHQKHEKHATRRPGLLSVKMDGRRIDAQEMESLARKMASDEAIAYRQRFYGLLGVEAEKINLLIDEAVAEIGKTKRLVTKGDQSGLFDIMKPFMEKAVVRRSGQSSYRPNPDIEKAKKLTDTANGKLAEISKAIEDGKKAFEARKARIAAYDETLRSEGGFEQIIKDPKGKDVAQFAFQIDVVEVPGTTIKRIQVKKVVPKFGNVRLKEGSEFIYDNEKTPRFINKAARALLIDRYTPKATIADVMPEELGGKMEKTA